MCVCVCVCVCVHARNTILWLAIIYCFRGFNVYIIVDLVKGNVLTLVGAIWCYRNDSYYYCYYKAFTVVDLAADFRVWSQDIDSIECGGCTCSGLYVPCINSHTWWESYCGWHSALLLCLCDVFLLIWALHSLVFLGKWHFEKVFDYYEYDYH